MSRLPADRRVRIRAACAIGCLLSVLGLPPGAAAQQNRLVDALIAFRTSLGGTYGDEGRQVTASLDRLAAPTVFGIVTLTGAVKLASARCRPAAGG